MPVSLNTGISNNYNQNLSFKGKWEKTNEGNPYYKTNSGTKAGAIMAIPAALCWLDNLTLPTDKKQIQERTNKITNSFIKLIKDSDLAKELQENTAQQIKNINFDEILKNNKKLKKLAIPFAILASGLTLGCGMLVDSKRNKKAEETANSIKNLGLKQTLMENDDTSISKKGHGYYESNQGNKYGALLGAGCGIGHYLMLMKPKFKVLELITNIATFALGGWIMGKIADHNTNKDAHKHA